MHSLCACHRSMLAGRELDGTPGPASRAEFADYVECSKYERVRPVVLPSQVAWPGVVQLFN